MNYLQATNCEICGQFTKNNRFCDDCIKECKKDGVDLAYQKYY